MEVQRVTRRFPTGRARPPDLEKRILTQAANVCSSERKNVGLSGSRQISDYRSRPALLKAYPSTHKIAVYDGQRLLGCVAGCAQPREACPFAEERSNDAFHCRHASAASLVPQQNETDADALAS
jgi:hypothetical protein